MGSNILKTLVFLALVINTLTLTGINAQTRTTTTTRTTPTTSKPIFQCQNFYQSTNSSYVSVPTTSTCSDCDQNSCGCSSTFEAGTNISVTYSSFASNPQCSRCVSNAQITPFGSKFSFCCNTSLCNAYRPIQRPVCENRISASSLKKKIANNFQLYSYNYNYNPQYYQCYSCDRCSTAYKGTIVNCMNYYSNVTGCQFSYKNYGGLKLWSGGCGSNDYYYYGYVSPNTILFSSNTTNTNGYIETTKSFTCSGSLCNNPFSYSNIDNYVLCEDGFYLPA